jgi:hypothetical protein
VYHFSKLKKHHVTTPPNLDIGVKENRRFNSSKTSKSCLASLAGGRGDPKPSLQLKHHRHLKCANTTKWSSSCASVLAFLQSFFEALLALSKCMCSMKCHLEAHVGLELIRQFPSLKYGYLTYNVTTPTRCLVTKVQPLAYTFALIIIGLHLVPPSSPW